MKTADDVEMFYAKPSRAAHVYAEMFTPKTILRRRREMLSVLDAPQTFTLRDRIDRFEMSLRLIELVCRIYAKRRLVDRNFEHKGVQP
jgi:hypothetical protein